MVPPGASDGLQRHSGVEEIDCVMYGMATFQRNNQTAPIQYGNHFPVMFNEVYAIINNGMDPVELLIMRGAQKNLLDTKLGAMPRAPGL